MPIWMILMIAISLSMDAFSLSLAYGTLGLSNREILKLSSIVGGYHFIMPILGMLAGRIILSLLPVNPNWIVFIVLFFIGCQMIIESFKEQEPVKSMTNFEMCLFGFAVSIDSFSVGIGLKSITNHDLLSAMLFCMSSFFLTYLGLFLGKKVHQKVGKISTTIGGTVLILLGFFYLS